MKPDNQPQTEGLKPLPGATCSADPSVQEIQEIILAEYRYWRDAAKTSDEDTVEWIAAGCMAASANILCAIYGHRAPWHPPVKPNARTEPPATKP